MAKKNNKSKNYKKNSNDVKINVNKKEDKNTDSKTNDKINNKNKTDKKTVKNKDKNNKKVEEVKIDSKKEEKELVDVKAKKSRVCKNKEIYLETEDYLKENNLDATFVDKKFNIDDEFVEKRDGHIFLKIIFGLFVFTLICFSCFSVYVFVNYEPEVKTKIVKETVVDENIVFLGDSITDFYDLNKYFSDFKVVNSGIDGNTTDNILNNMKERVYNYNPSKVLILIGTNDITNDKNVDEIVDNIKKIVAKIKENRPYAKIYLQSIYPINDTDDDKIDHGMVNGRKNDTIKEINSKLKEYSKENDITYIDMYSKLSDEDGNLKIEYTKEGLHLSDKGYELVTNELKKYLKGDK